MNELTQRLQGLSPEKRRLVEMLLRTETPQVMDSEAYAAPRSDQERQMVEIWEDILNQRPIGIYSNYFRLGGDSIQAIRIAARARESGIEIDTNQIFNRPTIAELLAGLGSRDSQEENEKGVLQGDLPLGPIQHWFFEQNFARPNHWNEAIVLESTVAMSPQILEAAVLALLEHHDCLRLRVTPSTEGVHAEYGPIPDERPLEFVTLEGKDLQHAIQSEADRIQASLSPDTGAMVRFCWMKAPAGQSDRLLIVAHHLIVDGISGRVLVEDLATACIQLLAGNRVELGRKSASFRQWTHFLTNWSKTEECTAQIPWWTAEQTAAFSALPLDRSQGANTEATAAELQMALDTESTHSLLRNAGRDINSALLAALTSALRDWSGSSAIRLDVEGHGREALDGAPDVSRTIGWFTSIFPLHLSLENTSGVAETFEAVRQKLRTVPSNGVGYGALRYLSRQLGKPAARSQIIFNYLGQFDGVLEDSGPFRLSAEALHGAVAAENIRPYLLQVVGLVSGGRLRFRFIYSSALYNEDTITRVAHSFEIALRQVAQLLGAHSQDAASVELDPEDVEEISQRYANS